MLWNKSWTNFIAPLNSLKLHAVIADSWSGVPKTRVGVPKKIPKNWGAGVPEMRVHGIPEHGTENGRYAGQELQLQGGCSLRSPAGKVFFKQPIFLTQTYAAIQKSTYYIFLLSSARYHIYAKISKYLSA